MGSFEESQSDPEITEDAEKVNIPSHAFDIIIADECHRGYTSKDVNVRRNVLNHFDAIKIGLTATPAAHTTAYFGHPVYKYSYEQAVLDGYLVDYRAIKIKSEVRINVIFLNEGELVEVIDPETGRKKLMNSKTNENSMQKKLRKS